MGNGSSFIKLPEQIERKHACINVQNDDEACFYWSIVSCLHPIEECSKRVNNYPHYSQVLNIKGLDIPMKLPQITKFEKMNDISVNVYALELTEVNERTFYSVVPTRLTKHKCNRHVNLLLIQDKYFPKLNDYEAPPDNDNAEENVNIKYHYVWIKNLSRLVSSQLNKHCGKKFICDR